MYFSVSQFQRNWRAQNSDPKVWRSYNNKKANLYGSLNSIHPIYHCYIILLKYSPDLSTLLLRRPSPTLQPLPNPAQSLDDHRGPHIWFPPWLSLLQQSSHSSCLCPCRPALPHPTPVCLICLPAHILDAPIFLFHYQWQVLHPLSLYHPYHLPQPVASPLWACLYVGSCQILEFRAPVEVFPEEQVDLLIFIQFRLPLAQCLICDSHTVNAPRQMHEYLKNPDLTFPVWLFPTHPARVLHGQSPAWPEPKILVVDTEPGWSVSIHIKSLAPQRMPPLGRTHYSNCL